MQLDQSPIRSERIPRLSILHLLVWTALIAAVLGFNIWLRQSRTAILESVLKQKVTISQPSTADFVSQPISALIAGTNLGGLVMLIAWRCRGIRFPWEPGEWMLAMGGIGSLVSMMIDAGQLLLMRATYHPFGHPSYLTLAFTVSRFLFMVVEFLVPALLCTDWRSWRWFFWIAMAEPIVNMIVTLFEILGGFSDPHTFAKFYLLYLLIAGFSVIPFAIAVIGDIRQHIPRSWAHWLGVTTLIVGYCYQEGWAFYAYYFLSHQ